MPVLPAPITPTHSLEGTTFTSLATPSRGSQDTAIWVVEIAPGTEPTPHSLTREEIFVVLAGHAATVIDGDAGTAGPGDAIVVPAEVPFELANRGERTLRLICCLPVGGQARLADGTAFTPPWAK
ncbi:MAG: hypothetical protein JWQ70_527 [Aeromicrobium sp.]|nr:hypothetical protein [Aeromicrobium sp.]